MGQRAGGDLAQPPQDKPPLRVIDSIIDLLYTSRSTCSQSAALQQPRPERCAVAFGQPSSDRTPNPEDRALQVFKPPHPWSQDCDRLASQEGRIDAARQAVA